MHDNLRVYIRSSQELLTLIIELNLLYIPIPSTISHTCVSHFMG